ncbi:MAG: hypothetical protein HY059_15475 [Proteobacteria bacterium]|nr:hypothetical protein [Pseudomonadota bacterium]
MSISCAVGAWAMMALAMDKADEAKFACYPDRKTCVETMEGLAKRTKRGFDNGIVGCRMEREEIVSSVRLPETAKLDDGR